MNRLNKALISPVKYVEFCKTATDEDGNERDVLKPVMFKRMADLAPYWMQIEISDVSGKAKWEAIQNHSYTPDEGEGDDWY